MLVVEDFVAEFRRFFGTFQTVLEGLHKNSLDAGIFACIDSLSTLCPILIGEIAETIPGRGRGAEGGFVGPALAPTFGRYIAAI